MVNKSVHQIPVVHHLPGVGKNFQDHYGFTGLLAEIPDEGIPDLHSVEGLHQWLVNQTGICFSVLSDLKRTLAVAKTRNP